MKNILISSIILFMTFTASAQETDKPLKKLSNMVELVDKDEITEIETYRSNEYIASKVAPVYLKYITKNKSKPRFFIVFNYYGNDWIFMNQVYIRCNESVFQFKLPNSAVDREALGGSVIETASIPLSNEAVKALQCIADKPEKRFIQFNGKYKHDEKLPDYVSRALSDMLYIQKNWTALNSAGN